MFSDGTEICEENRKQVEEKLERWGMLLKDNEGKLATVRHSTCVNEKEAGGTVRLHRAEITNVQDFKYMGSNIQENKECGEHVSGQDGVHEAKMHVFCEKRVAAEVKGKVYERIVRQASTDKVRFGDSGSEIRKMKLRCFEHVQEGKWAYWFRCVQRRNTG